MSDWESANHQLFDILAALTAASWRDLNRISSSLEELFSCQDIGSKYLFLLALSAIHEDGPFCRHLSSLASHDIHAAMQLSIAGARLSLCRQRVWLTQLDPARQEAHAAIRQAMACAEQIGLNLPEAQKLLLLERTNHLPTHIESQQNLSLNVKLGRIPHQLLFVLGMHRSGTSALSGLLGKLGLGVPKDLMPATDENPKGYWESIGVTRENDKILAEFGCNWRIEQPLPSGWPDLHAAREWRHNLLLALHQSFGESSFAVIKDPRFCILLKGLSSWMQDSSISLRFAILVRHPQEVVSSLLTRSRDPITKESALRLWINSVLESERVTRSFTRMFVMADDLFDIPRSVESELREFIRIQSQDQQGEEAACFIDAELRHHRADQEKFNPSSIASAQDDLLENIALRIYNEIKENRVPLSTNHLDGFYASLLETMG
ncbi:MAG: hypothetical protein VKP70_04980 [Cyanobacteriota bacterium]|nr:hypothetical protein [Cyanobacteriota bacterium]